MTTRSSRPAAQRRTYRHGDLARALLDAGIALAREGGPDAVVLREATRRAGVVPNAAYRHYANRDALLQAVRAAALRTLACGMEDAVAQSQRVRRDDASRAKAGLRAIGTSYLAFARGEAGLFRTAFAVPLDPANAHGLTTGGASGLNPYELLGAALDRLVDAGLMPRGRRPGAEYLAWSAVHGLALLCIEGPLRSASDTAIAATTHALLRMVEEGLTRG